MLSIYINVGVIVYKTLNFVFQPRFLTEPTLTSWEDFDSSDDDNDLPNLPRRYISEGQSPWSNFKDLVIGNRLEMIYHFLFTFLIEVFFLTD